MLNFSNFKMAENSLFAILLRSAWWISFAVAAAIIGVGFALVPVHYRIFPLFAALPFLVIGIIVVSRNLKKPSARNVSQLDERLRTLGWNEFSREIEEACRRAGYQVEPARGRAAGSAGADFRLERGGRVTALACRKWKMARSGQEGVQALRDAVDAMDAHDGVYVTLGEITDNARMFAARNRIRLAAAPELAALLQQQRPL